MKNHIRYPIILHDDLQRFRKARREETATLEAKLVQQLTGMCHESLIQVFLDVQKSYNSLDRGRCMEIMKGYGLGGKL